MLYYVYFYNSIYYCVDVCVTALVVACRLLLLSVYKCVHTRVARVQNARVIIVYAEPNKLLAAPIVKAMHPRNANQ